MEKLSLVVLLIALLGILYEDFRYRAINIGWFVLLLLGCLGKAISTDENWANNWFINNTFVISQLLILTLYFSIRQKQWVNLSKNYLGSGDILFIAIISVLFEPITFIRFWTWSLVIILLVSLLYNWLKPQPNFTIPLAGAWSLLLLVYFSVFP